MLFASCFLPVAAVGSFGRDLESSTFVIGPQPSWDSSEADTR